MKLEDLKVGDRVKYKYWKNGFDKSEWDYARGIIKELNYATTQSQIYSNCNENFTGLGDVILILKEHIISKLEPLSTQYKEILIFHENLPPKCEQDCKQRYYNDDYKNSIKLSDLKIGDRIRFSESTSIMKDIQITSIELPHVYGLNFFGSFKVHKDLIYCKLEPIDIESFEYWGHKLKYKEIPIEKEDNGICSCCGKYAKIDKRRENFHCGLNTCIICGGLESGIGGIYKANFVCNQCQNKEKPAPKGFKFDFNVQSTECNYDNNRKRMSAKMTGFGTFENDRFEMDLVLPYGHSLGDVTLGKTYTITIEEKQ